MTTMECDVTWCKHSSKLIYFRFDNLQSTKTHIIIMATMKTGTICNTCGSNDDWRVIGTRFDGRFCPRTATLYFWSWFNSFQLELARPNYINRKIETFEMFLVMQKALVKFKHRKIVFVKISLIQMLRRY